MLLGSAVGVDSAAGGAAGDTNGSEAIGAAVRHEKMARIAIPVSSETMWRTGNISILQFGFWECSGLLCRSKGSLSAGIAVGRHSALNFGTLSSTNFLECRMPQFQGSRIIALSVLLGVIACNTTQPNESETKFYGKDAKRATLTFSHQVQMQVPEGYKGDIADLSNAKWQETLEEHIRLQLAHMFGAFVNHDRPTDFVTNPGIPRERPIINITKVEPGRQGSITIHYDYSDIAAFKKDLFRGLQSAKIEFYLPKDPTQIYDRGLVPIADAERIYKNDEWALQDIALAKAARQKHVNLCTDIHYNSVEDYWYFWNPYQRGCPQSTKDFLTTVTATLKPERSTAQTWPRYKEFFGDNGNGKKLLVTFLVGIDESFKKSDLGVQGFEKNFRLLTEGKKLLKDQAAVEAELLLPGEVKLLRSTPDDEDVVFKVETNEKRYRKLTLEGRNYSVELHMHLVNPDSSNFVKLAVDGLQKSDLFIYDGHSGLGGYLSVGRLFGDRRKTLPQDKYQIFFFNGCSTFSSYNFDFFQLKATDEDPAGTKNLEILTTSVPASFTRGPGSNSWLIRGLFNGQKAKWQRIVDDIYRVDPEDSALTAVNGDEDEWNRIAP
jgi:hypothetical protein